MTVVILQNGSTVTDRLYSSENPFALTL